MGVCIIVDVTCVTVVDGVVTDVVGSGTVVVLVGGRVVIEVVGGSVVVVVGGSVVVDWVVGSGAVVVGSVTVVPVLVVVVVVRDGVVTAMIPSAARTDEWAGWSAARTCCVGHFLNCAVARTMASCSSSTAIVRRQRDGGKE